MNYKKYTINTTSEAEEYVCFILSELGIDSVEIEDLLPVEDEKQGGTFEELQPDRPEDDGSSRVSFYLEEDADEKELLDKIKEELLYAKSFMDIGEGSIEESFTKEEDWINNWKDYFKAFTIDKLLIKPTWDDTTTPAENQVVIDIDPGVSFGTGKHESTYMVLNKMQELIKPGDRTLDVGCGSGILSVAALKLGAEYVAGTDIDEDCISSTAENMALNGFSGKSEDFFAGDLTSDEALRERLNLGSYDLVFANILADIIIGMSDVLASSVKKGGYLITSGIINFKEDAVKETLKNSGLIVEEIYRMGEWRSIVARRPEV